MRKRPSRWRAAPAALALLLVPCAPALAADPAAPSAAAAANPASADALDPNGLLLFSVYLDDLTLSDGLGAFGEPEDPLIPVSELARLLEADVDVLPAERRIVGRLGPARRSLVVDLAAGVARIGPQEVPVGAKDAVVTPTEIYLRVSLLQKLLPLRVEVSPQELTLRLAATEKFPVQARLQRLANRREASGQAAGAAEQEALKVPQPYALFSPPGVDAVIDGGFQSGARSRNFRYDLRAAGDLLYSNFQGYLGSDEVGRAANARVLLQRRSVEGDMLGPLHAREITAGDTYTPALAIGARSISGRGISISTAPLEQVNIFNHIDLRGDLPPGFDVELYVNDVLKGTTDRAVNGRFEFLDVPLSPGLNVIRLVTFGPRGERTEEVQVINVGAALLRPGEVTFNFGVVDQNRPLIRFAHQNDAILGGTGLFADNGARIVAAMNIGVTDLVSLTAGAARVPLVSGGGQGLYTAGLRTSLFGLATQLDAGWDSRGGQALSLGLAGAWGQTSAVLRHAEYRHGFVDENNLGLNALFQMERRTELSVDSSINLRGRIVPTSMRLIRNAYQDGSNDTLGAARASTSLGEVLLSAGFEYQRRAYKPTTPAETLTGYIAASSFRSYKWQLRTTLDYDILPDFRARFLAVTVDRRLSDLWAVRFGLGESLNRTHDWNATASAVMSTRYGDFAFTGEYDNTDTDWRVSAQWIFGLGYDPAKGGYDLIRSGPGTGGSVLFNAFIDENGDGIRQPDEAPAPNVGLQGGAQRGALTGADGRILLTGLGAGPTAHMNVDLEKADTPPVATPPQRLDLRPRPGSVSRVDFPMRPTGGVMVKVELLRDDGKRVGLSSVRLQLRPEAGTAPIEAVTEFDGSAVFDGVPIGRYHLQLNPGQAEKLRMRLQQGEPEVVIKAGGDFAPDVTLQVRFLPAPADAAVAHVGGGG